MAPQNWVNIGPINDLLPGSTKPLPEPMLIYHQWGLVAFTSGPFQRKCLWYQVFNMSLKIMLLQLNLPGTSELTHWDWDKMATNFLMTFSNAFSWMKIHEFWFRFHWSLFPIYNISTLDQIMACGLPGDKPFAETMMVSLLMHICITQPQIVNSPPPSAAFMCQWIRSALVKIMACRLFGAKPLSKPVLGYRQQDP